MNLYLSACFDLISAFIALACGFATTAWAIFGIGFVVFFLALICNKVEER